MTQKEPTKITTILSYLFSLFLFMGFLGYLTDGVKGFFASLFFLAGSLLALPIFQKRILKIQKKLGLKLIVAAAFGVFVFGLIIAPSRPESKTGEVAGVQEQISSTTSISSTSSESEEDIKNKQLEAENLALKQKIATATTVSVEYDTDSDIAAQDVEVTKQANTTIATLGNTTQNQELFDVLEVVDGDTIKVSKLGTLRLIGMDTPETKDPRKPVQCFGQEATNKAKELLQGQKVWLEFDPANRIDKYGRTLAYAFRSDGYHFNLEMIREGYANNYTKFPHPRLDEFTAVAGEARNAQKGLFSPTTCNGDSTQAAAKPAPAPVVQQPKPAPVTTQKPNPTPTTQQPVTAAPSPAPASVYYANCDAVRAAGKAPIYAGQPGYRAGLDRDNDGIGCDKVR